jgi:hypothetical protein
VGIEKSITKHNIKVSQNTKFWQLFFLGKVFDLPIGILSSSFPQSRVIAVTQFDNLFKVTPKMCKTLLLCLDGVAVVHAVVLAANHAIKLLSQFIRDKLR